MFHAPLQSSNDAIRRRIRWGIVFLFVVMGYLIFHLYGVQIVRHDELLEKARKIYTTRVSTKTERGEIFDMTGNLLVGNSPCERVFVDPSLITDEVAEELYEIFPRLLNVPLELVKRRIDTKERQVPDKKGSMRTQIIRYAIIADRVPYEVTQKLKAELKERKIRKGVYFEEGYIRNYPKSRLLANVLGFTSISRDEVIAEMGLEKFFNDDMHSVPGSRVYERGRDGRPIYYGLRKDTDGRNGWNIYLTIQEPIQSIMEEELDRAVEEINPRAIYSIMVDPKTGNVMAMAQRPSFDPNDRSTYTPEAYRIRIIEDTFEPGSIMKPLPIAGALDCGLITPDTLFDCEMGYWVYARKSMRDSSRLGFAPVSEIVKKSSNIGTAKIGLALGPERLYNILRSFGLGERCGLPLRPESRGRVKSLEQWDGLSITRFPIGYGIGVTPVQMVRAYCALVDHGRLKKLRLVDRIENPDTGEIRLNPYEPAVQIFQRPETSQEIASIMQKVTEPGGTGTRAAIPGFHVAGKSGTSRKFIDGQYSTEKYNASFIGFVPAENPAFILLVFVDEPGGKSYYGGSVSAPVFKAIAQRTLKYLDIKPDPALLAGNNGKN